MQLSEQIRNHVTTAYLEPAKKRGEGLIRIKAGDIHRDLKWVNRVPSVCTTLASQKFQRETGLQLVAKEGPPSGFGTRVIFTYQLPSNNSSADSAPKAAKRVKSRLESLYGIAADVFRELGGGENYIRKEREELHFRKDHKAKKNEDEN